MIITVGYAQGVVLMGIDGYRHREGALKKVAPWINSLKDRGVSFILLEDIAPAHKFCIANDYPSVQGIEKMVWPGHSPDINASEHARSWMRRHVRKQFTPSYTSEEYKSQWKTGWKNLLVEMINRWVLGVIEAVRQFIVHEGKSDFHG